MVGADRPLPEPGEHDRPFWEAARAHRFVLPTCSVCSYRFFPPYPTCPNCQATAIEFLPASGRGTIFGAVVFERPYLRAFPVPYHVALVQLEEGPMIYGRVLDCTDEEVVAGMKVEIVFEDVTPEITLPQFARVP